MNEIFIRRNCETRTSGLLGEGFGIATSCEAESSTTLGTPNSSAWASVSLFSTVGSIKGTCSADRISGEGVFKLVVPGVDAEYMPSPSPRVGSIE